MTVSANTNSLKLEDEDFFAQLRKTEFSRLDGPEHHIYLDYTGGNLYAASLVNQHQNLLLNGVYGNPHSINPTSEKSTIMVDETRRKVLEYFNATDDYICVFTQNASGALKIIGECYPFDEDSHFVLLSDNHNSVNGIREFCNKKNGKTHYVPVQFEDLMISEELLKPILEDNAGGKNNLFAYPAQSNVSGVKHSLDWIAYAQNLGYDVLLDAAAYVPTSKLDLKKHQPEFVSVSFYKIFGYPTGIGCLLLKKSVFDKMQKPWFAGGTVTMVSVVTQSIFLATGHERFEDGTLNYLNLPAIKAGLEFIEDIGIERINKRVRNLTETLIAELQSLKHENGQKVVKIYGPDNIAHRGGNIIMSFYDENGDTVPFEIIDVVAKDQFISLRTGCFCNPGIDEINNCITSDEMTMYFVSRDKGDYEDMVKFLGKMRGAIRVSVGIATVEKDLMALVNLVKDYFKLVD